MFSQRAFDEGNPSAPELAVGELEYDTLLILRIDRNAVRVLTAAELENLRDIFVRHIGALIHELDV